MNDAMHQALARLQPITVTQTARLARLVSRGVVDFRALIEGGADGSTQETAILAIANSLDDAAEDLAFVAGVSETFLRTMPLADFAEFVAALIERLIEVNADSLQGRFVPALGKIGAALSSAKARVPQQPRSAPPAAAAGRTRAAGR